MDVASSIQHSNNRTDVTAIPSQAPTPEEAASRRDLVKAVKAVNQAEFYGSGREVTYSVDRHTKQLVTKLVDTNTGHVIDQIPAEYLLRLAEEVKQKA